MYYCTKCGKQLSDDSKFCINCGAPQQTTQTQPQAHQNSSPMRMHSEDSDEHLLYCRYSGSEITRRILIILIGAVFNIVALIYFSNSISKLEYTVNRELSKYSQRYEEYLSKISFLKSVRIFLILLCVIVIIESILHCFQIKQNYLYITNDGIHGEACPFFGFTTVSIKFNFASIRNVDVKNDRLTITTYGGTKYYFFVEGCLAAQNMINKKLFER